MYISIKQSLHEGQNDKVKRISVNDPLKSLAKVVPCSGCPTGEWMFFYKYEFAVFLKY